MPSRAAAGPCPRAVPSRSLLVVPHSLTFGLFPLGLAGGPGGVAAGPPDDFDQIGRAVEYLQGDGPPLLARMYVSWAGTASTAGTLAQVQELAAAPVPWDLVPCYRDPGGDVAGWAGFAADVVTRYGQQLASVQVTGEANLTGIPDAADGAFPRAGEALARGVLAAAAAKLDSGATAAIGFAVSPEVSPASGTFWPAVARLGGP